MACCGLAKRILTDSRNNVRTEESFAQEFPFTGLRTLVEVIQPNNKTITRTFNLWSSKIGGDAEGYPRRQFPYLFMKNEHRNEVSATPGVDGAGVVQVVTSTDVDDYGNPTTVTEETQGARPRRSELLDSNRQYDSILRHHELSVSISLLARP